MGNHILRWDTYASETLKSNSNKHGKNTCIRVNIRYEKIWKKQFIHDKLCLEEDGLNLALL